MINAYEVSGSSPTVVALRAAWKDYQVVEKKGTAFGQRLYELRASSEVVQGGTTFASSLDAAGIPRRTAYYWIERYEESIGQNKRQTHVRGDESAEPFWKALFYRLNALVPTYSDGSEHTLITLLESSLTEPLGEDGADFLESIVPTLERISREYAKYAKQLKGRQC